MKKIITILLVLVSLQSFSQSTTLVISQVYGAGGNAGALYNADYVELHNISGVSQSLSGFSIQYGSATGSTFTGISNLPAVSIPAGGYYLIQMSTVGATGSPLPTPDNVASPSIAMAAGAGKVALVNG
ncbi:MAG TPA: lamin tail domain-containing protein, partial [Ferruginibacter sp.]|nr:lamin tail domain-containing protein [Ferruginibacter sp.]